MEATRATLFDHLTIRHTSTLRDLLSLRDAAGEPPAAGAVGDGGTLTLATALAYERGSGAADAAAAVGERTLLDFIRGDGEIGWSSPGVRVRVSLMSLMEDWEEEEEEEEEEKKKKGVGERRHVCCVCVEREKGAAMVPCGHTFCRVCARKVWRSRGSCPLCNAQIAQVLHIF